MEKNYYSCYSWYWDSVEIHISYSKSKHEINDILIILTYIYKGLIVFINKSAKKSHSLKGKHFETLVYRKNRNFYCPKKKRKKYTYAITSKIYVSQYQKYLYKHSHVQTAMTLDWMWPSLKKIFRSQKYDSQFSWLWIITRHWRERQLRLSWLLVDQLYRCTEKLLTRKPIHTNTGQGNTQYRINQGCFVTAYSISQCATSLPSVA